MLFGQSVSALAVNAPDGLHWTYRVKVNMVHDCVFVFGATKRDGGVGRGDMGMKVCETRREALSGDHCLHPSGSPARTLDTVLAPAAARRPLTGIHTCMCAHAACWAQGQQYTLTAAANASEAQLNAWCAAFCAFTPGAGLGPGADISGDV